MRAFCGFLLSWPVGFFGALVFRDLWNWFVVPVRLGGLTYWGAYGFLLVIGFLKLGGVRADLVTKSAEDIDHIYPRAAKALIYALAWGLGALVHGWAS